MNRWQDSLKKKIHNSKVRAAKSIVSKLSRAISPPRNAIPNNERVSSPKRKLNELGIADALRRRSLKQHYREMASKDDLESLQKLTLLIRSDRFPPFEQQLKMVPGHKTRVMKILHHTEQDDRSPRTRLPQLRTPIAQKMDTSLDVKGLVHKVKNASYKHFQAKLSNLTSSIRIVNQSQAGHSRKLISSSSKNLRPALKKVMTKLLKIKVDSKQIEIDLNYNQQQCSYRSTEGAKMVRSLISPDLSEIVDCMANFLFASMTMVISSDTTHKNSDKAIQNEMFRKVKIRSNSTTDFLQETADEEVGFTILNQFTEISPTVSSIASYVRNILTNCKLSLSTIVIGAHYIRKLLSSETLLLTNMNCRRLVLCTMLLAHKMYEDQSLKIKTSFREFLSGVPEVISQLERSVLTALDYQLQISPQQYSQSYFRLRSFIRKHSKTQKNINSQRSHVIRELSIREMIEHNRQTIKSTKPITKRNSF